MVNIQMWLVIPIEVYNWIEKKAMDGKVSKGQVIRGILMDAMKAETPKEATQG